MNLDANLSKVLARYDELGDLVATHPNPGSSEYTGLLKELSDIEPLVESIRELERAREEARELEQLSSESEPDMRALAEQELAEVRRRIPELEQRLKSQLVPKDEADERNAILEVRAGTGGEEAALFAADLLRMYRRYAEMKGWRTEVLELAETDLGGCREASVLIKGRDVFARLKYESGVHRVQRIPVTETGGRIHTSAATVAVLPEAEEVDVEIGNEDLRIDTYRSQGAGGQHVNTTDSAVRITHLPSGVVVQCQDEKSQHRNKAKALKVLRARLFDIKRREQTEALAESRRSQVGSGDRSERVRTYNFPQGRVSDHRINLTIYRLDQVLSGEALDELIEPLMAEEQAARLAELQ